MPEGRIPVPDGRTEPETELRGGFVPDSLGPVPEGKAPVPDDLRGPDTELRGGFVPERREDPVPEGTAPVPDGRELAVPEEKRDWLAVADTEGLVP